MKLYIFQLYVEVKYVVECITQRIDFGLQSDCYLWHDWSWWITWGAGLWKFKCSGGSCEHGQQSGLLRQSTKSSVVNLKVRSLIWRQRFFFGGLVIQSCSALLLLPQPLSSVLDLLFSSPCPPPPPPTESSVAACLVPLTWTVVALPPSGWKDQLHNSCWLSSNCLAVRITSSIPCFKLPMIPLGQAPTTPADSFFSPPLQPSSSLL